MFFESPRAFLILLQIKLGLSFRASVRSITFNFSDYQSEFSFAFTPVITGLSSRSGSWTTNERVILRRSRQAILFFNRTTSFTSFENSSIWHLIGSLCLSNSSKVLSLLDFNHVEYFQRIALLLDLSPLLDIKRTSDRFCWTPTCSISTSCPAFTDHVSEFHGLDLYDEKYCCFQRLEKVKQSDAPNVMILFFNSCAWRWRSSWCICSSSSSSLLFIK